MRKFRTILEIGAGDSKFSIASFWNQLYSIDKIIVVEPNDLLFKDLKENTKDFSNIEYHNDVVLGCNEEKRFFNYGYASFVEGMPSFANTSYPEDAEFYLKRLSEIKKTVDINRYDDGQIDVMNLTCNGSELPILKAMKFRPKFIRHIQFMQTIEQYNWGNEVKNWFLNNGYFITETRGNRLGTFFIYNFALK